MSRKIKKNQEIEYDVNDYELSENDSKVLNLSIKFPHLRQKEIGKQLNLTEETVSRIKSKPAYKQAFKDYQTEQSKTWIQILLDARPKAAKKLIEHIDSDSAAISIRAAENILQLDKHLPSGDGNEPDKITIKLPEEFGN